MCKNSTSLFDIELGTSASNVESETTELFMQGQQSSYSNNKQHDTSSPPNKPNGDTGLGSTMLDSLEPTHQMILVSFLMFLFFGMHNILQEAIVNLLSNKNSAIPVLSDGTLDASLSSNKSNQTLMLGYAEVVGVLFFSYLERTHMTKEGGFSRVAPLRAYPLLTLCLFASSSLSNLSLSYINFPTKVVFRSCKLVPTMIIATIVNSRIFHSYEYLCALSICAGLVLFAMADYALDPLQFNTTGLMLVSGSVVADAILPNAQEHLFKDGSSRLEVTVFSNLFTFLGMTVVIVGNGALVHFIRDIKGDATLAMYFAVYTVLSYISISCYMTLVKRFGGVTAVLLTTARKAMTLVLSFLLFPKGFSWLYVYGSMLVLGAVMVASICKKLGVSRAATEQKDYSLAYRESARQSADSDDERSACSKSSRGTSATAASTATSLGKSQLESSAEAILEGISKRAYI